MGSNMISLINIFVVVICLIIIATTVLITISKLKKLYTNTLIELERDKNLIISGAILSELNKVESLINNKDLQDKYNYWRELFKVIRDNDVPKITDELIEATDDKKIGLEASKKLALIEFEIYMVKSKSQDLLNDIKEITLSEQRNREIVTKLKTEYRQVFLQYNNNNKADYGFIQKPLELQFENIDKLFSAFELAMENNVYTEVGKIVKALDDTIGNLKVVIEEAPSIILLGSTMIPNKIDDVKKISSKMIADGYNLDYLKIDYNIEESNKKIADIFDRLNVLNLEDSIFELRTILEYFDNIHSKFDKEKIAKKLFDEYIRTVVLKCKKLKGNVDNLSNKIDDIKYSYDLTDDDVKIIKDLDREICECTELYDNTVDTFRKHNTAYSKLNREMENINKRLNKVEDKLLYTLKSLGSLKEDEIRAREQLDEITDIIKQAKKHMNSFKLPIVPKNYYVELEEANEALRNMILELEQQPISIKTLNTRVDTARDLVLKLFNTSVEIVKTASMAETAIVYGNRYRFVNKNIDIGLTRAERDFMKGNFKSSLENAINSINIVEPGIHKRLLEEYKKGE